MGGGAWIRALAPAVLAAAVAACGLTATGRVIDGWPIGRLMTCDTQECRSYPEIAREGLDKRDPGHAPIYRETLYDQGLYVDGKVRTDLLNVCSGGCPVVAVFDLADGSVRAIGVGTPGIATVPLIFDYGPAETPR